MRLCVEVLRVLSLLFFELEGISKVGAVPPHPPFGPGALASAMMYWGCIISKHIHAKRCILF